MSMIAPVERAGAPRYAALRALPAAVLAVGWFEVDAKKRRLVMQGWADCIVG